MAKRHWRTLAKGRAETMSNRQDQTAEALKLLEYIIRNLNEEESEISFSLSKILEAIKPITISRLPTQASQFTSRLKALENTLAVKNKEISSLNTELQELKKERIIG